MGSDIRIMKKTCKTCIELKIEITRNGLKPRCSFKNHKFKERKEVRRAALFIDPICLHDPLRYILFLKVVSSTERRFLE